MNEIVDLTLALEDGMISYPTSAHARFEASTQGRLAIEGRETRKFTVGSHAGTHIDAAKHFIPGGQSVDAIPLGKLVGPAWLADLGELAPGAVIAPGDLALPPAGQVSRLLLRTNWDRFWNTRQYYQDWPVLDASCVDLLLSRGLEVLGMDFPSPDPAYFGSDHALDCPLHKRLFAAGATLVEYLTNLNKLKPGKVFLMALPLKLKGFDGSPARVAAYSLD